MTPAGAEVHGRTAPGFERVREVLAASDLGAGGGAFAAVVSGRLVVDLWTGMADTGQAWREDTVACLYSASKGVVTQCLVLLHRDGALDVDRPVAELWPEFGAAGKRAVTVRQLLGHSAGLPAVPDYEGFLGVHGENWQRRDEIRARLAAAEPLWPPGTAHGYHGLTFGYLAGQFVERLSGLSLPEFFRTRIAEPLQLDLRFGVGDDTTGRRARQMPPLPLAPDLEAAAEAVRAVARDPGTLLGKAFLAQGGTTVLEHLAAAGTDVACMNVGAGNGDVIGSARSLASLYAAMAAGECRSSLLEFGKVQTTGPDLVLGVPARWCTGFQGNEVGANGLLAIGPGTRSFGHLGAGGQLGGYDPDRDLAFGFLRNNLSAVGTVAGDLVRAVTEEFDGAQS